MYTFSSIIDNVQPLNLTIEQHKAVLELIKRSYDIGRMEAAKFALECLGATKDSLNISLQSAKDALDFDSHNCEYEVINSDDDKEYVECTICGRTEVQENESIEEMML